MNHNKAHMRTRIEPGAKSGIRPQIVEHQVSSANTIFSCKVSCWFEANHDALIQVFKGLSAAIFNAHLVAQHECANCQKH